MSSLAGRRINYWVMASGHHVVHQNRELSFYVVALFEHGLYYATSAVPMLVSDLLSCVEESKIICSKYYDGHISQLFWKNHPIGRVCVLGVVMGIKYKWIKNEDYVFLFLDDFSSKAASGTTFLICKCLKDVVLNQGLSVHNLVGKRLRFYGEMSLRHGELEIEMIEICTSLEEEIDHWKRSLELVPELNTPWTLSDQLLESIVTQGSSFGIDYEEVTNFTTPVRLRARRDFIEELQVEKYKEELDIVSPYRDYSSDGTDNNETYPPVALPRLSNSDSPAKKDTVLIGTPSSVVDATVEYITNDLSIFGCNEKQARSRVLKHLLEYPESAISIVGLYQMSQINDLVSSIGAITFNRQNLMLVKPFEQLKTEIFFRLIGSLVSSGLLDYINRNVVNLMPLKQLFAYCNKRLRALIKLHYYLARIELGYIRQKLGLPRLSCKAIVETVKETLRETALNYPNTLSGWWIEISAETALLVHLEYYNSNTS